MISDRMYAVPSSPFSMTPEELTQARADLQHAEREAAQATSWGHRTRWEQEAKSLQARIRGAEVQQRIEARHAAVNQRRPLSFQAALQKGVEEGRFMPCSRYWETANDMPDLGEDELVWLKAKAKKLQAAVDDPTVDVQTRTKAQLELNRLLQRIEAIEAARNPVKQIGPEATAGNSRTHETLSFEDTGKLLALAHQLGWIKSA